MSICVLFDFSSAAGKLRAVCARGGVQWGRGHGADALLRSNILHFVQLWTPTINFDVNLMSLTIQNPRSISDPKSWVCNWCCTLPRDW